MTFTMELTFEEIANIINICNEIDSSMSEFVSDIFSKNSTTDSGAMLINVKNHNTISIEITPEFSKFLLTGPFMDMASMSKMLMRIFDRLFEGSNTYFKPPVITEYDDDGNTIKCQTNGEDVDIDDMIDDGYYNGISKLTEVKDNTDDKIQSSQDSVPKSEVAIYNI